MILLHLVLFVSIAFSRLSESRGFQHKFKLPVIPSELREKIETVSLHAATKFNDIVQTDFSVRGRSSNLRGETVDNTFLEIHDEKFLVTDLQIVAEPVPHFLYATPDILNGFMETAFYWENVVVEGLFERYLKTSPSDWALSSGTLRITWKRIDAKGKISFLPSEVTDGFESTNYDLNMTPDDVQLLFKDENGEDYKSISIESKQFGSFLQEDLLWKLESSLPSSVDNFLRNLSINSLFQGNESVIDQYKRFQDLYDEIINNFADEMIRMVQEGVNESGFWRFNIPDISEEFSKKFVFITFWGHLKMRNGEGQDVRTLKRKTNFSLMINNGTFDVSGSLTVGQLSAGYGNYQAKIWNIGPSGSVSATVNNNALSFKLRAKFDDRSKMGFKIESYSLKAHIESISVTATGLGIFDWLLSLIVTLVINIFKGDISALIENEADGAINQLIQTIS